MVNKFESKLRARFADVDTIHISYASDCSGGDALWAAWESMARVLKHKMVVGLVLHHRFASEHKDAKHCHAYIKQNIPTECLFKDMHKRSAEHGGPVVFCDPHIHCKPPKGCGGQAWARLPAAGSLQNYTAGFECQDLSAANRHGRPLTLSSAISMEETGIEEDSNDDEAGGRSSRTFRDSVETIDRLGPRSALLENVGRAPLAIVVAWLRANLP